mmetsp:Transcript_4866/g.8636  ORF Transcript_4866/g.8636 Transcript_4866/m.8636 type:complete len:295 (+) Transcript_4866:63-947(+)
MDRATRLVSGRARAGVRLCRAYTTGSASTFDPVVTPKWLEEQRNVKILDATWYLPSKKLDGKDDFRKARIPNAQYFDIDAIADKSASLKHMLPPSNAFAAAMDSLNITNSDTVVVYETNGIAFAAARAWWMFRCFGHDDVRVLDGGMPAWRKDGNLALDETVVGSHLINAPGLAAMEAQESGKSDFKYQATLRENLVVSKQDILSDLSKEDNKKFLLDARGEARFRGTEPEAKPGLRSGHIPGSFSMHYNSLLQDGTLMKSKGEHCGERGRIESFDVLQLIPNTFHFYLKQKHF